MGRLLAALRGESPPYIVTLVLAALAWYVTHLVDRALQSPLVEASITLSKAPAPVGEHRATLEIENLSDKLFRNVEFQILFNDAKSAVSGFDPPIAVPPAVPMSDQPSLANQGMSFTLPFLQPENRLRLTFKYVGTGTPELVVAESATPILVVPPSCTTFFVRNEAAVLLGLILVFMVASVALVVFAPREREFDT